MPEYSDPDKSYTISYPDGWLPLTHEGSPHVSLASLTTGGYLKVEACQFEKAVPEAMRFAWDVVSGDTIAAGARLEIESVSAMGWCPDCQSEFDATEFFNECPRCHTVSGEFRRGRELEIASVEIE